MTLRQELEAFIANFEEQSKGEYGDNAISKEYFVSQQNSLRWAVAYSGYCRADWRPIKKNKFCSTSTRLHGL